MKEINKRPSAALDRDDDDVDECTHDALAETQRQCEDRAASLE